MDYNFASQEAELLNQIQLAKMLRMQAMQSAGQGMPQGEMVSGIYVPPHWTQNLAAIINPVLQNYQASQAENASNAKQIMLKQAIAKAQEDWLSSMPQGTPAQPAQMVPAQQGNNPSAYMPEQQIAPAKPAMLPSAMEQMQWMGRGAQIPGTGPLTQALGNIMSAERTREDAQQARREQLEQQQAERLELKRLEIQARLQQAREQGASALVLKDIEMEGRFEIARIMSEHKGQASADRAAARADRAADHLQRSTERLGAAAKEFAPLVVTGQAVQDMLDKYEGKSIPGLGYEKLLSPFLLSKDANTNIALIQRFANAVARSEIGLSQTLSEQAQQALSNMTNGKFSEDEFRAAWPEILAKTNASIANLRGAYGPEVIDRYTEQGGKLNLIKSKKPTVTIPTDEAAARKRQQELRAKQASGATGSF